MSKLGDALEGTPIEEPPDGENRAIRILRAEVVRARNSSGVLRRGRVLAVLLALCIPAAFAAGSELGEGPARDVAFTGEDFVPVSKCPQEVADAYEEVGFPRDSFFPDCPTVEEAERDAEKIGAALERYKEEYGHLPSGLRD